MSSPRYLTTPEVASRLGVSRRSISRWAQHGKLEPLHHNPGQTGAYLFDAAQIDAMADERDGEVVA